MFAARPRVLRMSHTTLSRVNLSSLSLLLSLLWFSDNAVRRNPAKPEVLQLFCFINLHIGYSKRTWQVKHFTFVFWLFKNFTCTQNSHRGHTLMTPLTAYRLQSLFETHSRCFWLPGHRSTCLLPDKLSRISGLMAYKIWRFDNLSSQSMNNERDEVDHLLTADWYYAISSRASCSQSRCCVIAAAATAAAAAGRSSRHSVTAAHEATDRHYRWIKVYRRNQMTRCMCGWWSRLFAIRRVKNCSVISADSVICARTISRRRRATTAQITDHTCTRQHFTSTTSC